MNYPSIKCDECGRFMAPQPGCAWKMVYDGGPIPMPDHEAFRCLGCTERLGGFSPQSGIKPEYSTGFVQPAEGGQDE